MWPVVWPTLDWWQTQQKLLELLSQPACSVWQFMSLIGLLTATKVHLGRLHMRPIQCHLKNNWRVPESLEKVISIPKSNALVGRRLDYITPCLGVYLLPTYASYNAFKTVWPELFVEPHVFLTPLH